MMGYHISMEEKMRVKIGLVVLLILALIFGRGAWHWLSNKASGCSPSRNCEPSSSSNKATKDSTPDQREIARLKFAIQLKADTLSWVRRDQEVLKAAISEQTAALSELMKSSQDSIIAAVRVTHKSALIRQRPRKAALTSANGKTSSAACTCALAPTRTAQAPKDNGVGGSWTVRP